MADVRTQQARERVALALTWAPHRPGEGGFADGIAALDDLADLVAVLETALRYELWVNHGCGFAALYGDDGEMSCGRCGWDFKRSDVLDTIEYVKGARLKRAAALAAAQEPPADDACTCRVLTSERPGVGNMLLSGGCRVHGGDRG